MYEIIRRGKMKRGTATCKVCDTIFLYDPGDTFHGPVLRIDSKGAGYDDVARMVKCPVCGDVTVIEEENNDAKCIFEEDAYHRCERREER